MSSYLCTRNQHINIMEHKIRKKDITDHIQFVRLILSNKLTKINIGHWLDIIRVCRDELYIIEWRLNEWAPKQKEKTR